MRFDQMNKRTNDALAKYGRPPQNLDDKSYSGPSDDEGDDGDDDGDDGERAPAPQEERPAAGTGESPVEGFAPLKGGPPEPFVMPNSGEATAPVEESPATTSPNRKKRKVLAGTLTCGVALPWPVHAKLKELAKGNGTAIREEALKAIQRGLS